MPDLERDPFLRRWENCYAVGVGIEVLTEMEGNGFSYDTPIDRDDLASQISSRAIPYGRPGTVKTVAWLAAVRAEEFAEDILDLKSLEVYSGKVWE